MHWAAVALAVLAVVLPCLIVLARPAVVGQSVGLGSAVTAVVTDIEFSAEQPRKARSDPLWDVTVRWSSADGVRTATGTARGQQQPYEVEQEVTVHVVGDDVSFETGREAGLILALMLTTLLVLCATSAVVLLFARRWINLVRVIERRPPLRIRILGVGDEQQKPQLRVRRNTGIHYRPVDRPTGGGFFALLPQKDSVVPEVGDLLDAWTAQPNGRGPFAVRRVSDGNWWLGTGPDPVPSTPGPSTPSPGALGPTAPHQ